MKDAIDALLSVRGEKLDHVITREDALSLVGRAVFTRFLLDRDLLGEEDWSYLGISSGSGSTLFDGSQRAAKTNAWLDVTFNGDFLPLGFDATNEQELETHLDDEGWMALGNILHRAPGGQLSLIPEGDSIGWDGLDFSRIPVDILSQVYEQQAKDWTPKQRSDRSIYYTPSHIAEFMVKEAFLSLEEEGEKEACRAKILDPAVGGGIFLIAAFRELFTRRWQLDGMPPNTEEIRKILYEQLVGFDIELSALRLTALSLYLTAIELDPEPRPLSKQRFEPLMERVLLYVGCGKTDAAKAGSLGSNVPVMHDGAYDIVIGNPPWTSKSLTRTTWGEVHGKLYPTLQSKLGNEEAKQFSLPDNNPDIAFIWRALGWCRPNGRLAFAIHGRLLFKQSEVGQKARAQLMKAFQWTGVLNGAALRKTPVWPGISAPFALLFGINTPPERHHTFFFYSPYQEHTSHRGRIRIDSEGAYPISQEATRGKPWFLKTLFRGTRLDLDIMEKMHGTGPELEKYWLDELGLAMGQGYQVTASPNQKDASFLINLPNFTTNELPCGVYLDLKKLPPFRHKTLHRTRRRSIYKGPLALIRKSIPTNSQQPIVHLAEKDLAYTESFYGFSAYSNEEALLLVSYLHLLISNPLFIWYCLKSSSEFGVERESIHLEDVKKFPVPRLEALEEDLRTEILSLSKLSAENPGFLIEHRNWLGKLYGLDEWDWLAIMDSLDVDMPYAHSLSNAERNPSEEEISRFKTVLERIFIPIIGSECGLSSIDLASDSPWRILHIGVGSSQETSEIQKLLELADEHSASQFILQLDQGGVLVGILSQYRFWTQSRARLLALDLLRRKDLNWGSAQ